MTSSPELRYALVPREMLGDVLRGSKQASVTRATGVWPRLGNKDSLVFWVGQSPRPRAVCVADRDREELFAWVASFHSDLAPLTSWCNVLGISDVERLNGQSIWPADLAGFEAAWTGAAIAEAMVLSQRSFETISVPACLATDTFAIGRSVALRGTRMPTSDIVRRLNDVRNRLRPSSEKWRSQSLLVSEVLLRLIDPSAPTTSPIVSDLLKVCAALEADADGLDSGVPQPVLNQLALSDPLLSPLIQLNEISAEERVRLLREIRNFTVHESDEAARQIYYFAAGLVISRIGGAESDLRLAEMFNGGYPQVLSWAAVLGGIGATTYWANAFGGVGRLVAREFARSFDVLEAPTSDISAEELLVIGSSQRGPVRFRTAQRNFTTISLFPGVVVYLSTDDEKYPANIRPESSRTTASSSPAATATGDPHQLQTLAEQLLPFMKPLLQPSRDNRPKRKPKNPPLPFKKDR